MNIIAVNIKKNTASFSEEYFDTTPGVMNPTKMKNLVFMEKNKALLN